MGNVYVKWAIFGIDIYGFIYLLIIVDVDNALV